MGNTPKTVEEWQQRMNQLQGVLEAAMAELKQLTESSPYQLGYAQALKDQEEKEELGIEEQIREIDKQAPPIKRKRKSKK